MYSSDCLGGVSKVQKRHCDSKSCPLPQTTHAIKYQVSSKPTWKKEYMELWPFQTSWRDEIQVSCIAHVQTVPNKVVCTLSLARGVILTSRPRPPPTWCYLRQERFGLTRAYGTSNWTNRGDMSLTRKPSLVLLSCMDCVCKVPCMREKNDAMLVGVSFVWNACVSCNAWQLRALS